MYPRHVDNVRKMRAKGVIIGRKIDKNTASRRQKTQAFAQNALRIADMLHKVVHNDRVEAAVREGEVERACTDKRETVGQSQLLCKRLRFGLVMRNDLNARHLPRTLRYIIKAFSSRAAA